MLIDNENYWIRFNEGWHISLVINYMDTTNHYLHGKSIVDSVVGILIPRILMPEKRQAGGRDNIERMTFYKLNSQTSMNVSYVGEGYGNFGKIGCFLFTFIIGVMLNLAFKIIFVLI